MKENLLITVNSILSCEIKGILEDAFVCEVADCFFLDIMLFIIILFLYLWSLVVL